MHVVHTDMTAADALSKHITFPYTFPNQVSGQKSFHYQLYNTLEILQLCVVALAWHLLLSIIR